MECAQCRAENPAEAKFCVQCGAGLERICPGCGAKADPAFKFCSQCGHDLSRPGTTTAAARSTEESPSPTGERRQATIVFSDLSGYTAMSEKLDPEEVEAIMSRIKTEAV
ncbi:MAG: zinc ribbon domain-containing protein, partial [SAR324 cluster bacterium]|nr:zinc ribbon domain-containing protein [SAR324 cluster bacterium]